MKFVAIPETNYECSVFQTIQRDWNDVMGNSPSKFKGKDNPVEQVNWFEVQNFITKLNSTQEEFTYRLPHETEWEYCCRSGSKEEYSFGNDVDKLKDYAWYEKNSNSKTHPVGQKLPNKFGLYDMHGNVWEWCQNLYDTGSDRVVRGGGWYSDAQYLRSANRGHDYPGYRDSGVGFRLLRTKRTFAFHSNTFTLDPSMDKISYEEAFERKFIELDVFKKHIFNKELDSVLKGVK